MPKKCRPWTAEEDRRALQFAAEGKTSTEIGHALNRHPGAVRSRLAKLRAREVTDTSNQFEESGDSAFAQVATSRPVKTLEDAIAAADIDLDTWYVDRWACSQWTVPISVMQGQEVQELKSKNGKRETLRWNPSKPIQTQQYLVRVWLKRIAPRSILSALDAIYERIAKHAPKYVKPTGQRTSGEPFLAVYALFDAHFGKLAWAPETGENYDLRVAETVYRNAVEDMAAESRHRGVSKILLPIGNDFFHVDNSRNTTYAGTPQDVDGRYAKVIESGEMAVIWAVERLQEIAPVSVVWVPGNHDPTTSYHLARTIAAWFRRCGRVDVDYGPSPRKYVAWGTNLLGLTHGDQEKRESLPGLMAAERPSEWAASRCREWLIGHDHRSRQWQTQPVEAADATVVRVLRSLAGTDAWHHRKGYVHSTKAAEVYFYGRDRGYAGHAVVPARAA